MKSKLCQSLDSYQFLSSSKVIVNQISDCKHSNSQKNELVDFFPRKPWRRSTFPWISDIENRVHVPNLWMYLLQISWKNHLLDRYLLNLVDWNGPTVQWFSQWLSFVGLRFYKGRAFKPFTNKKRDIEKISCCENKCQKFLFSRVRQRCQKIAAAFCRYRDKNGAF